MEKIKTVTFKGLSSNNKPMYDVELADGRKGRCFSDDIKDKAGQDVNIEIKEHDFNGTKQLIFNIVKPNKFNKVQKDWNFEKRKTALEQAVIIGINKDKSSMDIIKVAEVFFEFLNK